jgi:site-specific recombinase XerD
MTKKMDKELFFSKTREYLDNYLTVQRGKSPHTVNSYRDALTVFRRYVHEEKGLSIMKFHFEDCTRDLILDFIAYLKQNGYAESSCNQRLSALKAYLWYVSDDDILLQPITLSISRIPFLREPKLIRPVVPDDALAAILSAPKNSKIGIRDTTIMVILYDSAIRLDELRSLKISDLNIASDNPYLRIHGKGDKERIVTVTDKTVSHLLLYMKYYHSDTTDRNQSLFYTVIKEHRSTMSPGNVERIVKKYADQVRANYPEMPEKVYPHMMRRTRATNLYQDGVELELVSRILGHSSTQTTRIYATPSVEMLREAMENQNEVPDEKPLWEGKEEELARLCGLR